MSLRSNSEYWFTSIPGPSAMVERIADDLAGRKTVVLCIDVDFPWRNEMRAAVESILLGYSDAPDINYFDIEDQYNEHGIPQFLVTQFCSKEESLYAQKETDAINILKSGTLRNRVVWFKGIPEGREIDFLTFCRKYKQFSSETGTFVIEQRNDNTGKLTLPANISVIRSQDYITENDVLIYSSILYAHKGVKGSASNYYSNLVACLCGKDAEVAQTLVEEADFERAEPVNELKRIREEFFANSLRGISSNSASGHPFALLNAKNYEDIQYRIWLAQTRSIFPILENERRNFILRHSKKLEYCFDQLLHHPEDWTGSRFKIDYNECDDQNYLHNQWDEPIKSISDLELGNLCSMTKIVSQKEKNDHLFYIPMPDFQYLQLLYDMRNTLAHLKNCDFETIKKLLEYH